MTSPDQLSLGDFAPPLRAALGQWHSPPELCALMAKWLPGNVGGVLEPSAGGGNLIQAVLDAYPEVWVHAVEIDPDWKRYIEKRFEGESVCAWDGDFLQMEVGILLECDAAIMNSPLDKGQGPVHVAHALRFAKQAISVLRSGDLFGVKAYETLWSRCELARLAHLVRRPKFGAGGGAKSEFVVVDVRRPGGGCAGLVDVGWWDIG